LIDRLGTGPPKDELEDFLVEFLEIEYGVMLEDGSEESVVSDLRLLWAECQQRAEGTLPSLQEGNLERWERMAERVRREEGGRPIGTRVGGSDPGTDGSDESGDDEPPQRHGDDGMDVDTPQERQPREPVVDDDGFELVQPRRRR
jgi:pre-rRNA-processing protein TSR2